MSYVVALVNPEGDAEAWLASPPGPDAVVTNAAWLATPCASREDAAAVARIQNGYDRPLLWRDGRRWTASAERLVEVTA